FELTGIEARVCLEDPVLLFELIAPVERERLLAAYQRLVRGDVSTVSAGFSGPRAAGVAQLLRGPATGRPGIGGALRAGEGVLTAVTQLPPSAARPSGRSSQANPAAEPKRVPALLDLSQEVLREVTELMSGATSDAGSLLTMLQTARAVLPGDAADLLASQ